MREDRASSAYCATITTLGTLSARIAAMAGVFRHPARHDVIGIQSKGRGDVATDDLATLGGAPRGEGFGAVLCSEGIALSGSGPDGGAKRFTT